MPTKRRKLDKNMEQQIVAAKQKVELISAQINDIDEEDIQIEYREAFQKVLLEVSTLTEYYKTSGFTEESKNMINNYNTYLTTFLSEYEL